MENQGRVRDCLSLQTRVKRQQVLANKVRGEIVPEQLATFHYPFEGCWEADFFQCKARQERHPSPRGHYPSAFRSVVS